MTLRTLNYGKYGVFLMMGNAGFISSTVNPKAYRLLEPPQRRIRACLSRRDTEVQTSGAMTRTIFDRAPFYVARQF